jgi:integrase
VKQRAKLTQPLEIPAGRVQVLTLIRSENGSVLTSSALRFRFEKARVLAYKKAQEQGLTALAEAVKNFQFRALRAKAGTDKEETFGMAAAKDQLGHANESMTHKYVRHRRGKIVLPTR